MFYSAIVYYLHCWRKNRRDDVARLSTFVYIFFLYFCFLFLLFQSRHHGRTSIAIQPFVVQSQRKRRRIKMKRFCFECVVLENSPKCIHLNKPKMRRRNKLIQHYYIITSYYMTSRCFNSFPLVLLFLFRGSGVKNEISDSLKSFVVSI